MRERPILMSAPMVRAILAGTKTQTRRTMKEQPQPGRVIVNYDGSWDEVTPARKLPGMMTTPMVAHRTHHCPYGIVGERLLVKESHRLGNRYRNVWCTYEADGHRCPVPAPALCSAYDANKRRPSIHMPRWASRITLEITDVRVERLCEISDADCFAEGIQQVTNEGMQSDGTARGTYRALWESINGRGSWDINPWVWALTFRRICDA